MGFVLKLEPDVPRANNAVYAVKQRSRGVLAWCLSFLRAVFLFGVFASSLWVAGCASPPPPPPPKPKEVTYTERERFEAAQHALQQNIRLQTIVDVCKTISEETKALALETQEAWWSRNWPVVAVADAEFEMHIREHQSRLGEITGQLFALKFDLEARTQANDTIEGNVLRSTQRDRTCKFYLDVYANGQLDLANKEQYHPVLLKMQADYPRAASSRPRRVPYLAYGFEAKKNVGRSLVLVEKFVRHEYCVGAEIINIFNQWPRELYGVFCPEVDPFTLECKWGKCAQIDDE